MMFVGMMFGGGLFGNSADKHGRRLTLVVGMLFNGIFGLLSSFSTAFYTFVFFRFLSGVGFVFMLFCNLC
jgi:MFS family permease